jgi:hypothetical protein
MARETVHTTAQLPCKANPHQQKSFHRPRALCTFEFERENGLDRDLFLEHHRFDNVGCCNWCCVFPMALAGCALLPLTCIIDVVTCCKLGEPDVKLPPSPPPVAITIVSPPSPVQYSVATPVVATAIVEPPKSVV